MGHRKFIVAGIMAVLALLSSDRPIAFAQAAKPNSTAFHSADTGYSLSLPTGWRRIPDPAVQAYHTAVSSPANAATFRYDSAFQRQGKSQWFTWPYVIVQVIPYPKGQQPDDADIAQFLKGIAGFDINKVASQGANPQVAKLLSNGAFGQAKWDAATKTARMPMQMDVAGAGTVKAVCTFHFGRRAVIAVNCYALAKSFDSQQAAFASISDSFRFDTGFEYDNHANSLASQAARLSNGILNGVGTGTMVGAACGIVAALGATLGLKKRNRQVIAPAPTPPPSGRPRGL